MFNAWHLLATATLLAWGSSVTGCSTTADAPSKPAAGDSSSTASATSAPSAVRDMVGDFPAFPRGDLRRPTTRALHAALDRALERGMIRGAVASVIVTGEGSWSGAVGRGPDGRALTTSSRMLTASIGKTITTAAILRLVDEGKLGLDDQVTDHLPPELATFDLNDARIRDLLGMRGGFADPDGYVNLVDEGYTLDRLLPLLPTPHSAAGETTEYTNIYFVILGAVLEHVTGQRFAEAVTAGVLSDPALQGIRHPRRDAMAGDGWQVESDTATLARWGYELYGGHVVSETIVREMVDFHGEFYGLGTLDFSGVDDFRMPAVGHGGGEPSVATRLVIFPELGVVVSVQANTDGLDAIFALTEDLRDAARP